MNVVVRSDKRVLLAIRLRQLGDVLATLGTLRALKEANVDQQIVFMVDTHYHPLLKNVEFIDLLLPEPPKIAGFGGATRYNRFVDRIRRLGVDCALDFHSNVRSAIVTYLSGAPLRIGFDVRGRKILYTDVEPRAVYKNGQYVDRTSHESALALASRCGSRALSGSVENTIPVSPAEVRAGRNAMIRAGVDEVAVHSGRIIGLNPGKPYPAKAWSDEYFVAVADRLVEDGSRVVVMCGPGERESARRIVAAAGDGVYLAPELEIDEIGGFLKNVSALVTIDSGLKHVAVAVGVASLTLFGPTSPQEWHMGSRQDRYLSAGLSCSPCRLLECPFGTPPCMSRLKPDDVLRELSMIEGGVGVS